MRTEVLLFVLIVPCFVTSAPVDDGTTLKMDVEHCKTFKTLFSLKSPMMAHVEAKEGKEVMTALLGGGVAILKRLASKGPRAFLKTVNPRLMRNGLETTKSFSDMQAALEEAVRKLKIFHGLQKGSNIAMACANGKASEHLHFENSAHSMATNNEIMEATIDRVFSRAKKFPMKGKKRFAKTVGFFLGREAQQDCFVKHNLERFKEICETEKSVKDSKS